MAETLRQKRLGFAMAKPCPRQCEQEQGHRKQEQGVKYFVWGNTGWRVRVLILTRSNERLSLSLCPGDQDFYSHSNWVELGERQPHPHLLWPRRELRSLAQGMAMPLCGGGSSGSPSVQPSLQHLLGSQAVTLLYPCRTAVFLVWLEQFRGLLSFTRGKHPGSRVSSQTAQPSSWSLFCPPMPAPSCSQLTGSSSCPLRPRSLSGSQRAEPPGSVPTLLGLVHQP